MMWYGNKYCVSVIVPNKTLFRFFNHCLTEVFINMCYKINQETFITELLHCHLFPVLSLQKHLTFQRVFGLDLLGAEIDGSVIVWEAPTDSAASEFITASQATGAMQGL